MIEQFERWSGIKVSSQKTVIMVLGEEQVGVKLKYTDHEVSKADDKESVRYLGFWSTRKGDMSKPKEKVFEAAREAKGLIRLHPLTPECAIEMFLGNGAGLFRYSAALVEWTWGELKELEKIWMQAYQVA